MQALKLALARARKERRYPQIVAEIDGWIANKHERRFRGENLDTVRERIVQYILRLIAAPAVPQGSLHPALLVIGTAGLDHVDLAP